MYIKHKLKKFSTNKIIRFYAFIGIFAYSCTLQAGPIEDLQPGHWVEIPGTNLSQVYPSPLPPGNSGPSSVMQAWSGGAYDTKRDRLIVMGGGHLDYGGNELYAFNVNSLTWERLTEPSNPAPKCENYMPDGRPATSHTYNQVQYSADTDSFIRLSGGFWGSACPLEMYQLRSRTTDIFDFSLNEWKIGKLQPDSGDDSASGRVTAVDPATGHIWMHGTKGKGQLLEYEPKKDNWTVRAPNLYLKIGGTAAIDPIRRIMVIVGGYNGQRQIKVWDLTKNYGASYTPPTSGDTALEFRSGPGFVFDPTINKFVGWGNGSEVYTLDPVTWAWEKIEAAPSNSVIPSTMGRGVYGRFRYIPSKNVYMLVNRTTENVYFYKLNSETAKGTPKKPAVPSSSANP